MPHVSHSSRVCPGPMSRIVSRGDFLATMYRHLGIDPEHIAFTDHSGRPIPIVQDGKPIPELVAHG